MWAISELLGLLVQLVGAIADLATSRPERRVRRRCGYVFIKVREASA